MKTGSYDEVRAAVRWSARGTRHLPGGLAVTRYDADALLIHHWDSGQAVLLESLPELESGLDRDHAGTPRAAPAAPVADEDWT